MVMIVWQQVLWAAPIIRSMGVSVRGGWWRWVAVSLALCACSPVLDWRENLAEGTGIVTSFPCRPDRHSRAVEVGGSKVQMQMLVCTAGGATYAVSFFDAGDAPSVDAGLANLRATMLANVQAGVPRQRPLKLPGMNASTEAVRLSADGRLPDGVAMRLEAAFFAKGLRVFQAAVVGPPLREEAVDPFFEGLRLPQ